MYVEFEPNEKYSNKLADISDNHKSFKDAGWILTDDDYVIDIDELDKETIKKLIVTFNIKTQIVWTTRGVHLYFKKPDDFKQGANRVSPLGFKYEIKHIKNTKAVTIKQNGILRKIENEGIREDAPFIFTSRKKHDVLLGLEETEGRNNALFKLRSNISSQNNWRKILRFVNENIFAKPLCDEEFDSLTREMSVTADKDNEYEVASWLLNDFNFVQYGTRYYFKYKDDYTHEEDILKNIVYKRVGGQKTRYVDEVIKQLEYRCEKIPQETIFNIKFKNGYLRNGEFTELITNDFTPYVINIDYSPDTKPVEYVDNYIKHLTNGDEDYRNLLLEILGHTLIVDHEFKRMLAKFFIFVGDGGNGKGTLLQIIKTILGTKNVTGMGIKELSDERYLPSFKGKLANLGDDLQDGSINDKDMKMLKNVSTCDYISTRELYKGAEDMFFTGSLIFTSNHILRSWEKGESYKRRVVWLPMYGKIAKKDPLFISKLTSEESLKYWIKLIVEGYLRLYKNCKFTNCDLINNFNNKYHRDNNPALDFLENYTRDEIIDQPIVEVQRAYSDWWEDNMDLESKMNTNILNKTIEDNYSLTRGCKRINGKVTKCFVERIE